MGSIFKYNQKIRNIQNPEYPECHPQFPSYRLWNRFTSLLVIINHIICMQSISDTITLFSKLHNINKFCVWLEDVIYITNVFRGNYKALKRESLLFFVGTGLLVYLMTNP
jgi:hypothetical protein